MFPALFLLILTASPLSNCLGRCSTTQASKRFQCTNMHDFPRGSDSVEVLQMENSSLGVIPARIFYENQFISLKVAVLQYDNIESIAKRAFNGLSSLILLDLTGNELEELHTGAFQGAEALKVLILTKNRIQYLKEEALVGLNSLIYLDVSYNNIGHISGNVLRNLPALRYLDVSFNPLTVSSSTSFLRSTSLAVLRISFRGLQEISQTLFADLPNLQVLDLSGSDLKVWPPRVLYPLAKLRVLYSETPLLVNEDTFVPGTVEKFVQARQNVDSGDIVTHILSNLDEFNVHSKDIDVMQYLEDFLYEQEDDPDQGYFSNLKLRTAQKCLLFAMLVYLSLAYTMCLSQILKSFIQKPYERVYVDEI